MFLPTPPPPSREARELAGYLEQVVDAYKQDHPDVSASDIRQALTITHTAHSPKATSVARIATLVVLGGVIVVFARLGLLEVIWIVLAAVIFMVWLNTLKAKGS